MPLLTTLHTIIEIISRGFISYFKKYKNVVYANNSF